MQKKRVFISSVQSEFVEARQMLFDYLTTDSLFCKFFEPFIFEKVPALPSAPQSVFLKEIELCDIYIGLFGKEYGYEDADGISPTEREFDCAMKNDKTLFVYISNYKDKERNPKEVQLIRKAEQIAVRKQFETIMDLRASVYNSLIRYLEENEIIRSLPFDATLNPYASWKDLDKEKIKNFVYVAYNERSFKYPPSTNPKIVLTHLNLVQGERITNAALLLFGKNPQKFFITSEVKCAMFFGTEVEKPIPSYQIYKGDVFELIVQAKNFVVSNIRAKTGTRDKDVQVAVEYELPLVAITEAIVNAVCHRDYTSNASVQVMLFRDRLEVWNPGILPYGMTIEKLKRHHSSVPVNPLLAEPMFWNKTIEKVGTGTFDIVKLCKQVGLKEPEFIQDGFFRTVLWRKDIGKKNKNVHENVQRDVHENVHENIQKDVHEKRTDMILKFLESNESVSLQGLANNLNISIKTVRRDLYNLKNCGIIERIGPNKGGYWKIIIRDLGRKNVHEDVHKSVHESVHENVHEYVRKNVHEKRTDMILKFLESNESVSLQKLANNLNISIKTVQRDLNKLKACGILERIGPNKGGYWKIIIRDKR